MIPRFSSLADAAADGDDDLRPATGRPPARRPPRRPGPRGRAPRRRRSRARSGAGSAPRATVVGREGAGLQTDQRRPVAAHRHLGLQLAAEHRPPPDQTAVLGLGEARPPPGTSAAPDRLRQPGHVVDRLVGVREEHAAGRLGGDRRPPGRRRRRPACSRPAPRRRPAATAATARSRAAPPPRRRRRRRRAPPPRRRAADRPASFWPAAIASTSHLVELVPRRCCATTQILRAIRAPSLPVAVSRPARGRRRPASPSMICAPPPLSGKATLERSPAASRRRRRSSGVEPQIGRRRAGDLLALGLHDALAARRSAGG